MSLRQLDFIEQVVEAHACPYELSLVLVKTATGEGIMLAPGLEEPLLWSFEYPAGHLSWCPDRTFFYQE